MSPYLRSSFSYVDAHIRRALKAQPSVPQTSTTRALGLEDKELELKRKIVQWIRQVQPVYMPNLRASEQDNPDDSDNDTDDDAFGCSVWDIELRLPSALSPAGTTSPYESRVVKASRRPICLV